MAPSAELIHWLPLPVLAASLLGSAHCIGMCGGLAATLARGRWQSAQFHLGRLTTYSTLGALAGTAGERALGGEWGIWATGLSTAFLALSLISLGVATWKQKPVHFTLLPSRWLLALQRAGLVNPLASGALTGLLPCGWLHAFLLSAVATGSSLRGAILMAAFWAGTVPALGGGAWLVRKALAPLAQRLPRLSAALLVSAGLATLGLKFAPHSHVHGHGHEPSHEPAHEHRHSKPSSGSGTPSTTREGHEETGTHAHGALHGDHAAHLTHELGHDR